MEILFATQKELAIIRQMAHETWHNTYADILSAEQIAYMLDWMYNVDALTNQLLEHKHVFLIIRENNNNLGYASYELNCYNRSYTKIHKIYVLPTTQGKGVGRMLMNRIAELAKEADNNMLTLNVNKYNKAVGFYKKIGFKIVGEENIPIDKGFVMEDFILAKRI